MKDKILCGYLETLPKLDSWLEWSRRLARSHHFNTFYTHHLCVEGRCVKLLNCPLPCEQNYLRQVVENSPSDINAICPQNKVVPIQLKFKDILVYSLRRQVLHQVLCASMNIRDSAGHRIEHKNVWHLDDYSGTEVYITYHTDYEIRADTISSLYITHQFPFILIVPTAKSITAEIQQFIDKNSFVLFFSIEDELWLIQITTQYFGTYEII